MLIFEFVEKAIKFVLLEKSKKTLLIFT
jgi:hypothetical protein